MNAVGYKHKPSGSEVNTITGCYQADSVISRHVENGECDVVLSPDSDFCLFRWPKMFANMLLQVYEINSIRVYC